MLEFLKRLFKQPTVEELVDDVMTGRRRIVPWTELRAAVRREVQERPKDLRLPHKGNRFKALEDVDVRVSLSFHAPYSDSRKGVLPRGEIIELEYEPDHSDSTSCSLRVVRYDELADHFVDLETRSLPEYSGYMLSLSYIDLDACFQWLSCDQDTPSTETV